MSVPQAMPVDDDAIISYDLPQGHTSIGKGGGIIYIPSVTLPMPVFTLPSEHLGKGVARTQTSGKGKGAFSFPQPTPGSFSVETVAKSNEDFGPVVLGYPPEAPKAAAAAPKPAPADKS